MAKKSAAAKRRERARERSAEKHRFDDSKYDGVLFSATYDYNELLFSRAAETLGPRLGVAVRACAFISLAAMIILIMIFDTATLPVVIALVASLVFVWATTNWGRLQTTYARKRTTLAVAPGGEQRHVAITANEVHVENEQGPLGDYNLSDLSVAHQNGDCTVMGFGGGRYAFVPSSALSEGRYHDLGRLLDERLAKR